MEALHILLLGPPDVVWRGAPWKITRRTLRALLFYLAIEPRVNRDELRTLFWPDELDEKKSHGDLRVALNRLRAALPDPDLLIVTPNTVSLDRERVSVDALQFLELSTQPLRTAAQLPVGMALPERIANQLRQAARLWRSPRFLDGFNLADDNPDLDHWQAGMTMRYQEAYLGALIGLIDNATKTGDLDSVMAWAQAGLAVDPWDAELHERVMRCMLMLERFEAAASYGQSLLNRYEEEGEEMPKELVELCAQSAAQRARDKRNPRVDGWSQETMAQVPLVGGAAELAELRAAFRRGGVALLWGEAGAGKTRLISEFLRTSKPRPRLLTLRALQGESGLPYQPLIDALRRGIRQAEWQRLPVSSRKPMAYLLPEIGDGLAGSEAVTPEILRGRIFEALRLVLVEISQGSRLLVELDNAQWCDEGTLAALAYLMERRFFSDHGLLLLAARSEEDCSRLDGWIDPYRASAALQQIFITPFGAAETAELAHQVLDRPLDSAMIQPLVDGTGGNPLFLLETLFALLEYAPETAFNPMLDRLPISGSLHNMLRERLARLSPATRQAATAAAALEIDFDQGLLEKVTLFDAETVAQALDELQDANLVCPARATARMAYRFKHGMAREVIEKEQGPARLRLLHLRAAHALESDSLELDRRETLLARQYEVGGDLVTAMRWWLKAAARARAMFAAAEALNACQAAQRLLDRLEGAQPAELLFQLYSQWGELASEQRDAALMEQVYTRLLSAGEDCQEPLLIGSALGGLAELASLQNDPDRALELFQRAAFYLQQLTEPLPLVQLYIRQGGHFLRLARYAAAADTLERACAAAGADASAGGDPRLQEARADAEYRLGMAYNLTGWPLKAQAIATRSLRQDKTPAVMYGHMVMSNASYYLNEPLASLEHARLGRQMAHSLGSPWMSGCLLVYQARVELALGQVDAAWEHCQEEIEAARSQKQLDLLSSALCIQGDIDRLLGDSGGAVHTYRGALEMGQANWDSLTIQHHLAIALLDLGEVDEGLHQAQEAYLRACRLGLDAVAIQALTSLSMLLLLAGRMEQAAARRQEWHAQYHERGFSVPEIVEGWAIGAEAGGGRGGVAHPAEQTLRRARQRGNVWWELHAYRRLQQQVGALNDAARTRVWDVLDAAKRLVRHPDLVGLADAYLKECRVILIEK